ncbi:MAG: cytochrome oxidase subunit III, partial [Marivirga sp.]|nr:cytochrome oxidase subunit III [Marivirga sp.]
GVTPAFWDDPVNHPMLPLYLITVFMLIVVVLVGFVAIYLIKILNMMSEQAEREKALKFGIVYTAKATWWDKFLQQVNASVPVDQEKNIELDHDYDGIKELDNHLPPWWKWLFIGSIGFAVFYVVIFHFTDSLPLQEQEYQNELAAAEDNARKFRASQPEATVDESALVYTQDAAIIEKGKQVFMSSNCGSCHRNDGGGNTIGPNLTDGYWLHGGDVKEIFQTIKNGKIDKGMPAWGKTMSPKDVKDVTFFVISLQGTKPANAKAPQGELFAPEPIAGDSIKTQASL